MCLVRCWQLAILSTLLSACSPETPPSVPPTQPAAKSSPTPQYVGAQECSRCHAKEYERWRGSHHDLAMQEATPASVVGDFNNAGFSYAGVHSTFTQRDEKYFVTTDGPQGELVEYQIAYTFGVEPLQQYLIGFPDGRLQALNIVWDTRPAAAGGQRWFHLYPDENVDHRDILHWTRPLQNWNFMCAECHSTGLEKSYDAATDRFATTWAELDVACEACHGPGSEHIVLAEAGSADSGLVSLSADDQAVWVTSTDTGIARREPARNSRTELETCARCHARRSIFSEDYEHGSPLMNTHRPALLTADSYFADGQILDEVYVYGSFLQSAMHRAGVSCSDCHDAHSLALKAPGNGLCAQCHSPAVFETTDHHHHEQDSPGSQCVDCHMPSRNYMVVDARRDHSFRVPRPDLSNDIGTPNACNGCHTDQDATWAAKKAVDWYGANRADSSHFGEVLDAGHRGLPGAGAKLVSLADNSDIPAIVRATAVTLLATNPHPATGNTVRRAAVDADPLLRLAAAQTAPVIGPPSSDQLLGTLLNDPIRAVRLQAVSNLLFTPADALRPEFLQPFEAALGEYRAAQLLNADRAESHVNLGVLHVAQRELSAAVEEYTKAIELLPEFVPAYINMADIYRDGGREDAVETILQRGLAVVPDSADLHHARGLSLVRQQEYGAAIDALRRANELDPDNSRYAYVLGIALNSTGDTTASLRVLRDAHQHRPGDIEVLVALATISRDAGERTDAIDYANKLLDLDPGSTAARQILQELNR